MKSCGSGDSLDTKDHPDLENADFSKMKIKSESLEGYTVISIEFVMDENSQLQKNRRRYTTSFLHLLAVLFNSLKVQIPPVCMNNQIQEYEVHW